MSERLLLQKQLQIVDDAASVARVGASLVAQRGQQAVQSRGVFTLVLTGGSSPLAMYERMATEARTEIPWEKTQLFWGDERAVAPTVAESNYGAAKQRLLSKNVLPEDRIHRMHGEATDLPAEAARYASLMSKITGANPPVADLVLLGLGADGHVLSLYPGCPEIDNPTASVVALLDPPMNPKLSRISLTAPVVHVARSVVLLAVGENKRTALHRLLHEEGPALELPARILLPCAERVMILSDRAAVSSS